MIKGVIFDMDGVIVDSLGFHNKAFRMLFLKLGVQLNSQDIKRTYGRTALENIEYLLKKYRITQDAKRLAKTREKIFLEITTGKIRPMRGAAALIRKLHEKGFKLAIASSSKRIVVINTLKSLGLLTCFRKIVSSEDVKRGKPYPDAFLAAAKKLRLTPGECIVIEDASAGLKAAKRAKIPVIVIPNKYTRGENFNGADLMVHSAEKLTGLGWIKKFN